MAKIYLNVEAENVEDLRHTLIGIVGGIPGFITAQSPDRAPGVPTKPVQETASAQAAMQPKVEAGFANPIQAPTPSADASQVTAQSSAATDTPEKTAPAGTGEDVTKTASPSDAELDRDGHPWSADLHASTKGKTQDGLWRMGRGKERPAPVAGYPKTEEAPVASDEPEKAAETTAVDEPLEGGTITPTEDDEDEFAAFTAAAQESEPAVETEVPARVWSDADLSRLANQAATKLNGNIGPLKEIISAYIPYSDEWLKRRGMKREDDTPPMVATDHSRNVPVEDREALAQEIEKLADFTFAG